MIVASLLLATALHPQAAGPRITAEQRIESELDKKLQKPEFQTTLGQIDATNEATRAYRVEIKRVYEKLVKGLPASERASLIESQKAWESLEIAEEDSIGLIAARVGTIHRMAAATALKEFYRHRLEELNARFDDFSDEEFETMPGDEDQPITLEQWNKDHARHRRPGQ